MEWLQTNLPPFLEKWPTLITGLLAVTAAIGTILFTRWQHNDVIRRKERSLRSYLPEALAGLITYLRACLDYIGNFDKSPPNDSPTANPTHIDKIKEYIGYADNKNSKEYYEIINNYQSFNCTIHEFLTNNMFNKKESAFKELLELNASILKKFPHARNNFSTPQVYLGRVDTI